MNEITNEQSDLIINAVIKKFSSAEGTIINQQQKLKFQIDEANIEAQKACRNYFERASLTAETENLKAVLAIEAIELERKKLQLEIEKLEREAKNEV